MSSINQKKNESVLLSMENYILFIEIYKFVDNSHICE